MLNDDDLSSIKDFAEEHMSEYPITCGSILKLVREYEALEELINFRENKSRS